MFGLELQKQNEFFFKILPATGWSYVCSMLLAAVLKIEEKLEDLVSFFFVLAVIVRTCFALLFMNNTTPVFCTALLGDGSLGGGVFFFF